jgi:hypothetical protein
MVALLLELKGTTSNVVTQARWSGSDQIQSISTMQNSLTRSMESLEVGATSLKYTATLCQHPEHSSQHKNMTFITHVVHLCIPSSLSKSIRRLEPILARFELHAANHTPLDVRILFNASTSDIITEYSLGNCWNSLYVPDLNELFFKVTINVAKMVHVSSYFPFVIQFLMSLPEKVAIWLAPDMEVLLPHFAVSPLTDAIRAQS